MNYIYHNTTPDNLEKILECGFIKPFAPIWAEPYSKPVICLTRDNTEYLNGIQFVFLFNVLYMISFIMFVANFYQ